jgi:hypothetical protein
MSIASSSRKSISNAHSFLPELYSSDLQFRRPAKSPSGLARNQRIRAGNEASNGVPTFWRGRGHEACAIKVTSRASNHQIQHTKYGNTTPPFPASLNGE